MTDARAMYSNLAYDPLKDVDQIGEIADVPLVLVGSKSMPANGLKELIPYLRSRQEKTSMADAGVGSASQPCSLLFLNAIHTRMTTVS